MMLKVAYNITNLSDARYFSAVGFDWLIFKPQGKLEEYSKTLQEMIGWVEGAKIGLHVASDDEIGFWLEEKIPVQGFWLEEDAQIHRNVLDRTLFSRTHLLDCDNSYQVLSEMVANQENGHKLLDLNAFDPHAFELNLLNHDSISGVCLAGDMEDRPGFKTYQSQEDWIDLLDTL